jgi:hypothetical protein
MPAWWLAFQAAKSSKASPEALGYIQEQAKKLLRKRFPGI